MKGRSCWESGTVRSLCNSGCLSKLNRGQYRAIAKATTQEHGAVTLLSICPTTKPSSSCYILLIVCLRCSCHSFILHVHPVICRHGCSLISASSLNNIAPHAVKKISLSSFLHSSLNAVSIPLSFFLLCCSRSDLIPLFSLRLLHLTFAYG